jgi:hypothetical protein
MKETFRVLPDQTKIAAVWDNDDGRYPSTIRVPMSDGKLVTYKLDIQQPHPAFLTAMEQAQKMRRTLFGYSSELPKYYKGKHEKTDSRGR